MRYAAKADRNQPEIVAALERVGASVQHLHSVGHGCPDLLVGFRGRNHLIEVKDGTLPPSRRGLTDAQIRWHMLWSGEVAIANSAEDALRIIGVAG